MVAESGVDNDVVLRGDGSRCLGIIKVPMKGRFYARAIRRGEGVGAVLAADKAGDGGGAERWGGEKVGEDAAANVAGGTGEEDLGRCGKSHVDAGLMAYMKSRQTARGNQITVC